MKVRVASAGTGKTASLVLRYLELIAGGTPLRRIGGVTFTRKAADELRVRVGQAVEEVLEEGSHLSFVLEPSDRPKFLEAQRELGGAAVSTIHGFMGQCLRLAAPLLHLDPDFSILGDWEARTLFEEEWNSLLYLAQDPSHLLAGVAHPGQTEALLHLFSKRSLAEAWVAAEGEENQTLLRVYDAVYAAYKGRLRSNLLSPSELELRALELTRQRAAMERVLERVSILLVDEYQDVNPLQGRFFAALEDAGLPVEIVGDPKQSIYAFRNADVAVFRQALQEGQVLPPLTHSFRHSATLVRFLNRLTQHLAKGGLGFSPGEAPEVHGVREARGRLELHWTVGEALMDELRAQEAEILAKRLQKLGHDYPYSQMAVLVRSYASVGFLESAFKRAGLPYVLLQGRGYYERQEVRDLYHALRAALDPRGLSLMAWLRGPFGQVRGKREEGGREEGGRGLEDVSTAQAPRLSAPSFQGLELSAVEQILRAENPARSLELNYPEIHARLVRIQQQIRLASPLNVLKFLVREPMIAGRAYQDFLELRARENVDALLFQFAPRPPQSLEALLERLELLSGQAEAGDVPQSGEGIQILTVHRAKGLEWPVAAVFDLGRKSVHQAQVLYIGGDAERVWDGEGRRLENLFPRPVSPDPPPELRQVFALEDTPQFSVLQQQAKALEEEETYRLFYVAASRARDVLVLSGSVRQEKPEGWAATLAAMGLGPEATPYDRPDFLQRTWLYRPTEEVPVEPEADALEPSPWIGLTFETERFPPLFSPSAFKREEAEHEPLPLPDPTEGEEVPGKARAVGTLVHYAIGQNWQSDNPEHLRNLEAQEVMFPFNATEREAIMAEVAVLLQGYERMLGRELPWPRDEDYPEFAMALPMGTTVWQGVIDRLYLSGGRWYLEDYKTDAQIRPERYHFQLGVYLEAVRQAWGVEPEVRLVYLRFGELVEVEKAALEAAVEAVRV